MKTQTTRNELIARVEAIAGCSWDDFGKARPDEQPRPTLSQQIRRTADAWVAGSPDFWSAAEQDELLALADAIEPEAL